MYARFAAVATFALVMTVGCNKKPPQASLSDAQSVDVTLQITSISPDAVAPNAEAPAKLFGSAFETGATVTFSGATSAPAGSVEVRGGNTIDLVIPALPAGRYDVTVENPSGETSTLRGGLGVGLATGCDALTVTFDFDRYTLRKSAKATLDAQMACLQQRTGPVRVEGHCDERGTVDYNLALGQRRAEAVKQYLVRNGVAASRVNTVSYGEERPVDRASTEAAWAKNRRAEIAVTE
ncbi:MAG: peptidoglycan-associated lipoprotein Pal [Myxococcota bacterium]